MLGKKRDREHARVLSGDPELTRKLINSLKFRSKYTAGCLSFEEANTTEDNKKRIMEMFESSLFSSIGKDNYNITWIEHLDKGRLELNFVIPKVHLSTGRQLHVYSHAVDMKLTRSFKRLVNFEYGFSEPEDRPRSLALPTDIPPSVNDFRNKIHERIMEQVESGDIKNRDEIISALNNSRVKVQRVTRSSISIHNPFGTKNIRLKGEIYSEKFNGEKQSVEIKEQKRLLVQGKIRKDYYTQRKLRTKRNDARYKSVSTNQVLIENKIAAQKQMNLIPAADIEPGLVTKFILSELKNKVEQHERDRKTATTKFKKGYRDIVGELGYYEKFNERIKNKIRGIKQRAIRLAAVIKRNFGHDGGFSRNQGKQQQITRGGNSIER